MKENWTDFEKYVFEKLGNIERELFTLKGTVLTKRQSLSWGALAGSVASAAVHAILKALQHS